MLQKREKMYHIKPDKRSGKSAKLVCEGLADMLNEKSYCDITISDVCSRCGIARTTFYRLFDTLDDVMLYQFDSLFEESIAEYAENQNPHKSLAKTLLEIAANNKPLISAIVASGRSDLFSASAASKEKWIHQTIHLQISEKDSVYCTAMLTQLAYAVLSIWVNTGCHESSDALYEIMKRNIKLIDSHL